MRRVLRISVPTAIGIHVLLASAALAADWPTWRHDAARTAASPEALAETLHLAWQRDLPLPAPAWPKEPHRLGFDAVYEPVARGKTLFVPSMVTDSVTAYDTDTGAEKWTFFAGGPVRFAPVVWEGGVAFASDDGYLYCVNPVDGALRWKVCGLPSDRRDRKILGNERLVSLYPARGGPVLVGKTIVFGAGLLPFEGVYLHAVDADTGRILWSNTESHAIADALDDHKLHTGPRGVAGISPHGYLSTVGDRLAVPSGRGLPAFVDPGTGRLDKYESGWGGRPSLAKGSWFVAAAGDHWFHSGDMYTVSPRKRIQVDPANRKGLGPFRDPVLADGVIYCSLASLKAVDGPRPVRKAYTAIVARRSAVTKIEDRKTADGKWSYKHATLPELWRLPSNLKVHIKAGNHLYAGAHGTVAAVRVPESGNPPQLTWRAAIEGTPATMLAADGKLFVVTREGRIACFGPTEGTPKRYTNPPGPDSPPGGYALVWGIGTGGPAERLAREEAMRVIVVDPDATKVNAFRRRLHEAGLYGTRISVHTGNPVSFPVPPYMASLVTVADPDAVGTAGDVWVVMRAYRALRPYGGRLDLPVPADRRKAVLASVQGAGLDGAQAIVTADGVRVTRAGPLPEAADWTHPQADAAKSFVGADARVRAPFATLWFGGSMDLLFPDWDYTHSTHPIALVARGRTFIQTRRTLSAADIYTGRLLWQTQLPARAGGFYPYAVAGDDLYVACDEEVLRLSGATGSATARFHAPDGCPGNWATLYVWGDGLFGRVGDRLVTLDRQDGSARWTYQAAPGRSDFAIGGGKVFLIEFPSGTSGSKSQKAARIRALDAADGSVVWEAAADAKAGPVSRPGIAYARTHDLVVLHHRGGIAAYNARTGTPLWHRNVPAPKGKPPRAGGYILHRAVFVDTWTGKGFDPKTGADTNYLAWQSKRGCSFAVASEHLMTLRDGHASFFEMPSGQRTYLQGFRGGCTPSLIPADGLLVAPNYARGCTCNYAIYTSLGLVPAQDLE